LAKNKNTFDICPHCGESLSPWQQVLLSVDRTLMCKNCWNRINLDRNKSAEKLDEKPKQQEGEII
jgi:hypothetical protein